MLSRHLVSVVVVVLVLPVEPVLVVLSYAASTDHPASSGSQGWGWVLGHPSSLWGAVAGAGLFLIDMGPWCLVLSL
jgi:hypothetical protein